MKVRVIYESELDAALIGTGLSFGRTSGLEIEDIQNNKEGIRDKMLGVVRKLAPMGNGHNKAIRQTLIAIDITAPLSWWKQADTYKVSTVAQSESTIHTLTKYPFKKEDFEPFYDRRCLDFTINWLNELRETFLNTQDPDLKQQCWEDMVNGLPCGYMQRRIFTCNYETLRCIFRQRAGHKLGHWKTFINSVYEGIRHREFLQDLIEQPE